MSVCACGCHREPDIATRPFPTNGGVSVRDVIEAAVACASCQDAHTPALLDATLPCEGEFVAHRGMTVITPEGRSLSWKEYVAEQEKRAESWRDQPGEGPPK